MCVCLVSFQNVINVQKIILDYCNLLASKIIFTGNNKKIQLRFITNEQKRVQFKVDSIILISFLANFEKIWHIGQE